MPKKRTRLASIRTTPIPDAPIKQKTGAEIEALKRLMKENFELNVRTGIRKHLKKKVRVSVKDVAKEVPSAIMKILRHGFAIPKRFKKKKK